MSRSLLWGCRNFQPCWTFLQLFQHDPTPNNMANRDNNDDDHNGRKSQKFNSDHKAFESEDDFDDYDFSFDDDIFQNSSQKKKPGDSHLHVLR